MFVEFLVLYASKKGIFSVIGKISQNETLWKSRASLIRQNFVLMVWDCNSVTNYFDLIVTAHLRGMRPAPTNQKDTPMLREKLKL